MQISKIFWFGLALLAAGEGPLLAVIAFSSDPDPNPSGWGLLAFVIFWPAIFLIAVGWRRSFR